MSRAEKADARDIREFLDELAQESWLPRSCREWPYYTYHYSDVHNVASILNSGVLYSRDRLSELGSLAVDAAHKEIIQQSDWAHRFVRLYFGPQTPTQYWMEGIRPPEYRKGDAHCPVPVFLLFDARKLLAREGCGYTNGNLATSGAEYGRDARFLRSLDFRRIYHRGPISDPARTREIVFARNAEVLFEGELDLEDLQVIVCRTGAERETLLHLLGSAAESWRSRIRLERPGERLFYREWAFVSEVTLIGDTVLITTQPARGLYTQKITVTSRQWKKTFVVNGGDPAPIRKQISVKLPGEPPFIGVEFKISDKVAYKAKLTQRQVFKSR